MPSIPTAPVSQHASKPDDQRGKDNAATLARIDKVFAVMFAQQEYPPGKPFMTLNEFITLVSGDHPKDKISQSSMRRVFAVMRDTFNLPVDYISERKGHGFTEPVASFALDTISEEQVYVLIQSVQALRAHQGSKALVQVRRVLKKACYGITLRLRVEFEDIEEALSFHLVGFDAPAPVDPAMFKAAVRAILKKQEVRLEHRSVKRRGEVKQKTVEPLHLAVINHVPYLFHYDPEIAAGNASKAGKAGPGALGAKDEPVDPIRKFALTRISGLEPTGRGCKPRKFDVHERVNRGMGAFDDTDAADVELRFSPRVAGLILERPWHKTQTTEELADGGLTMRLRSACTPELDASILRWAGDVEVIGPGKLRGRIHQLGLALAKDNAGDGRAPSGPA